MSTRVLKWLAVVGPIVFWLIILFLRAALFSETRGVQGDLFTLILIAIGAGLFSAWIFRTIENREVEIRHRSEQLAALHAAGLALTTELDLGVVLQRVVDL